MFILYNTPLNNLTFLKFYRRGIINSVRFYNTIFEGYPLIYLKKKTNLYLQLYFIST